MRLQTKVFDVYNGNFRNLTDLHDDDSHRYEGHCQGDERKMLKLLVALKQHLQRAVLAPVLEQNESLMQRQEEAMPTNSRVLDEFASALRDCAEELARHTEAIRGMAEASEELRDTVQEMNKVLRLDNINRLLQEISRKGVDM